MDTYKEDINEFVDWITGKHSLTEVQTTSGLPVAGSSIRKLLSDHLKKPFIFYEDTIENMIYFFSSEDSKQLWLSHRYEDNNEAYTNLVLYSMVKPSSYTIVLDSTFLDNLQRYVMYGDEDNDLNKMIYTWDVKLVDASEVDSLMVSYTITNPSGKVHKIAESKKYSERNDTSNPLNLYNYLEKGDNNIEIVFTAQKTGAKKTVQASINVLEFNISSTFQFYNKVDSGDSFVLPLYLERNNTTSNANIYVNIDGKNASINGANAGLPYTVNPGIVGNLYLTIGNAEDSETGIRPYRGSTASENVTHIMQIWAETTYNNISFKSNLLYYTFEIKADLVLTNKFINVGTSYTTATVSTYPLGALMLYGTQYSPIKLPWGYYTDGMSWDTAITVDWKLVQNNTETHLASIKGTKGSKPADLSFIPTVNSSGGDIYLKAYFEEEELIKIPVIVSEGSSDIVAPSGMAMELTAYNKNNNAEDKNSWETKGVSANVTLSNAIKYDTTSGWYDHSLRLSGTNEYAKIDYNVFDESIYTLDGSGRTIEFEFESEKVNDDTDVIMRIGKNGAARIEVTPNSATLYDNSNTMIIKTNFKSNERVKLAFIINPVSSTTDNNLIYIVANGILERASRGGASFKLSSDSTILIGGSASGIRFFNMRIYNYAISYTTAYNNYVYDSDDKNNIIAANNIMSDGAISYTACCAKLDTILIEGDLDDLLSGITDKDQSTTNATITRTCPSDSTRNFKVVDAQIRKHGQSTLSYPITSMKFWLNKKYGAASSNDIPTFTCAGQSDLGLAKNRYIMKEGAIPSNKFVLQANYADSSGVHNGGLQRLIQDTWYNASINSKYMLRTDPQLFASVSSSDKTEYDMGNVWHDYIDSNFPYDIRISPDSFPCVVFYKNGDGEITYLGQYVFMDDKKSDFLFGERSIYKADPSDPFCLKTINKKNDTSTNRIWDNANVLRIEVLDINNIFTSYMNWTNEAGDFDADIPEVQEEYTDPDTGVTTVTTIERHYNWENYFEMIYPDPDDLEGDATAGTDKFGTNSKFRAKAQPFIDWVKWLTDTRNNYTDLGYESAQAAFEATASQHLDLYKMAAYYIFMLRFGLVDSGERNVQIKTYDGEHFHYEPWDMDIAMGNRNDGGIAFAPPVDRNTRLGEGYAISGRSATTSNWLWDALEAWTYWNSTIVPKVAQALYDAGLTYETASKMFDDNYAAAWSEVLYNESGYYKYVIRGGGSQLYLNWLQGARLLHRHWWLSSSMNYYDAKWGVGSFNNSTIDLYAGHSATEGSEENVVIYPTSSTFFKMMVNETNNLGTKAATRTTPAQFNIGNVTFQPKVPTYIFGANFIEKLDLSVIASTLARISLGGSYDKVLGAPIKELNIGTIITNIDDNTYSGTLNIANPGTIETTSGSGDDKVYALTNLQTLNIRGQLGEGSETGNSYTTFSMLRDTADTRGDLSSVTNLYAMGSGIVTFYSSEQGNRFTNLELPSSVYSFNLNNTTWENLSFWRTERVGESSSASFYRYSINGDYSYFVPSTLTEVVLNGTTAHTLNSKNFVMAWINGIIASLGENPSDEDVAAALATKTLKMNDVNWSMDTCGVTNLMTYDELALIAQIGTKELKGYILLANEGTALTSEQLTQLTQWFGDDIFTYSSSGLIIDYNLDRTIISVGGDITIDSNGEIHLKEGNSAILHATKFLLDNQTADVVWTIRERILDENGNVKDTTSGAAVNSCFLDTTNPKQIILKAVNSTNEAYDIFVHASLDNTEIVIHIDPTDYPELEIQATDNTDRDSGNTSVLYGGGITDNYSVVTVNAVEGAVDIQDISWSILTYDGVTVALDITNNPTENKQVNNSTVLSYKRGTNRNDVRLTAGISATNETIYNYTLTASVNLGGKVETLTKNVTVMNDLYPIVSSDGSYLYNALNTLYTSLYGTGTDNFYRSTLLALTGTIDFSPYSTIGRVSVSTNKSIFYYLENVTGVILDGCTALTSTYTNGNVNIAQMNFTKMTGLTSLSINGCTGLTDDVDLSGNTEITTIDARNTTVNIILPENTKVSQLYLGTPTKVSLIKPTVLAHTSVAVTDSDNLDSIEIIDNGNYNAYRIFNKLK